MSEAMGMGVSVREMADRENMDRENMDRESMDRESTAGRFHPRVQICKLEHYTGKPKLLKQRPSRVRLSER